MTERKKITLAFLTTDNREQLSQYEAPIPFFGTAPAALLSGLAEFPDELDVHVISCARTRMLPCEKLASNIWFHQPVVPKIGWGRTAFLGCARAVRKQLKSIRPDIVHAQGTERDCAVSMMLAPSGPRVLTIHGHMARIAEITGARFPSYYWMAKNLERMAIKRSDGLVSISNYTQDRVKTLCKRSWVVPNAVDSSFFNVSSQPSRNLALCVGTVTPWKRQLELIEAMDQIPDISRPHVVFLGSMGTKGYDRLVREAIDSRDWCEYQGFADRDGLKEWLSKASLLILPSIEDNCPMVILEAMAAGVPVAASRIGGIPDLVDEWMTGCLFDPENPADIADKICWITRSPELRQECAIRSRQKAVELFSPKIIAEKHLKIYRELLG